MADHRLKRIKEIWENHADDQQSVHVSEWVKSGKTRKERKKRWAAFALFARRHRMSARDVRAFHKAHKFHKIQTWARAKVRRIRRKIRRSNKPDKPDVDTSAWGGSQAAGESVVVQNSADYGAWISSRKRAANDPLSISNPSSDHNEANRTAYAWDLATFNGAPLAHEIARDLGISGYSTGNYNGYAITRPWGRFRVQILWAVSGHYNHVHVGIRRA